MASLDPADRAVARKDPRPPGRQGDKLFASKKEREAVEAFYQNRNFAPLWLDKGVENARAEAVVARLKKRRRRRPRSQRIQAPELRRARWPDALAEAELQAHAHRPHLCAPRAGRAFPYTRVSRNIELPQAPPEPADILSSVANAADAGKALERLQPAERALSPAQGDARGAARQGRARQGDVRADRHHRRQHGALALVSARSRQRPCARQPARTSRSR